MARSKIVKKMFNRIAKDELVHLFSLLCKFGRLYAGLSKDVDIILTLPKEAEIKKLAEVKESAETLQYAIHEEQ
ncbi:MAG: hypothetical protein ACE5HY_04415 [Candidatus Hydrothermarchaeales archaeon]